ncbi:MAG: KGGVGR-motif variant AAA ATPase, partial [Phototrophicaceae bacterium]
PSVVAFHSFKGGVGRTLHALLFALSYKNLYKKSKILLVDGDFEAPGISYWYEDSKSDIVPTTISYADILTIAHSDTSDRYQDTIEFACAKLEDQLLDLDLDIYVLPAFRTALQLESIPIKPDDLYRDQQSPLYSQELLTRIGEKLGVDVVVVDLRAGMSDLSSGILFDPRVCRVFVTTFSGQSRKGSLNSIEALQRYMPRLDSTRENGAGYTPIAIINQLREDDLEQSSFVESLVNFENELKNALMQISVQEEEKNASASTPFCIRTFFNEEILNLPTDWKKLLELVTGQLAETINELEKIVYTLPVPNHVVQERRAEQKSTPDDLKSKASRLKENAKSYGESTGKQEFLITEPLKKLAEDFRSRLPNTVVIGVKGTGKTYTAQQILYRQTWGEFVSYCLPRYPVKIDAQVFSALQSKNIPNSVVVDVGWGKIKNSDRIAEWLGVNNNDPNWWTQRWKDIFAWQAGYEVGSEGAGDSFIELLNRRNEKLVAIVDGIEDHFQDIAQTPYQQIALRTLLQEIPSQLGDKNLGVLIFVREDMIRYAIKYNSQQFISRYENYKLNWSRDEALRLAVWLARDVLDIKESIETLSPDELEAYAIKIWGRKLGKDDSRQAYSSSWVLDVLSNFNGQLHARDIVRFIRSAAEIVASRSEKETTYPDRILDPIAIRNAVQKASEGKIEDLQQEIPRLGDVFNKLKRLPAGDKRSPIEEDRLGLDVSDIQFLVENGVIQRDRNNLIFFAEIFRQGLDFERSRRGQSRVRR